MKKYIYNFFLSIKVYLVNKITSILVKKILCLMLHYLVSNRIKRRENMLENFSTAEYIITKV